MSLLTTEARWVERCGGAVYEFALAICGNRGDAEEIVQQSFAEALSEKRLVREGEPLCRSLIRTAAGKTLRRLRERQPESFGCPPGTALSNEDLVPVHIAPWHRDPQELYSKSELRKILNEALQTLPLLPRVAVMLRDRERLSIEEIASLLDLSLPAARSYLLQGRLKLRNQLNPYFRQQSCERGS